MSEAKRIYALMRASEMNEWVGGADPEQAGLFSHWTLGQAATLGPDARVVDLGCGNGRVALRLMSCEHPPQRLLGLDIVPPLVDFCRREITPAFPNATFELIEGINDHYERFKTDAAPRSRTDIVAEHGGAFTVAYAFSVFTHVAPEDFASLLRFAADLLAPRGEFLFSAFTLTPFSRAMIVRDEGVYGMGQAEYREAGEVLVARPDDPLALIAYSRDRIETYIREAGLILTRVEYGTWMGGNLGGALQDMYLCRKPPEELRAEFDVQG